MGIIQDCYKGNYLNPTEKLQNVPETAPISVEEIINQLAKMKGNKACGSNLIVIEVWKRWEN